MLFKIKHAFYFLDSCTLLYNPLTGKTHLLQTWNYLWVPTVWYWMNSMLLLSPFDLNEQKDVFTSENTWTNVSNCAFSKMQWGNNILDFWTNQSLWNIRGILISLLLRNPFQNLQSLLDIENPNIMLLSLPLFFCTDSF